MRQFQSMLHHLARRNQNEYAGQAALHGVKIPLAGETQKVKTDPLTEDEEKLIAESLERARLRKLKRG